MLVNIRKALSSDLEKIAALYSHIHDEQDKGTLYTGWVRNVYPTIKTAETALQRGDLFVEEANGNIVGAAIINNVQVDVYKNAAWKKTYPDEQILVLHTLVIDPYAKGKGFGKQFVNFYEQYAAEHGCKELRLDTNELNTNARKFYQKLGYSEIGTAACEFNGIKGVKLVLLEKSL